MATRSIPLKRLIIIECCKLAPVRLLKRLGYVPCRARDMARHFPETISEDVSDVVRFCHVPVSACMYETVSNQPKNERNKRL